MNNLRATLTFTLRLFTKNFIDCIIAILIQYASNSLLSLEAKSPFMKTMRISEREDFPKITGSRSYQMGSDV